MCMYIYWVRRNAFLWKNQINMNDAWNMIAETQPLSPLCFKLCLFEIFCNFEFHHHFWEGGHRSRRQTFREKSSYGLYLVEHVHTVNTVHECRKQIENGVNQQQKSFCPNFSAFVMSDSLPWQEVKAHGLAKSTPKRHHIA